MLHGDVEDVELWGDRLAQMQRGGEYDGVCNDPAEPVFAVGGYAVADEVGVVTNDFLVNHYGCGTD